MGLKTGKSLLGYHSVVLLLLCVMKRRRVRCVGPFDGWGCRRVELSISGRANNFRAKGGGDTGIVRRVRRGGDPSQRRQTRIALNRDEEQKK